MLYYCKFREFIAVQKIPTIILNTTKCFLFRTNLGYTRLLVQQDADEADKTTRHVAAIRQHKFFDARQPAS